MEKIVKKIMIPKFIEVQSSEFKKVTEYKTFDGMVFKTEKEAQEHEDKIKAKEIPSVDYVMLTIGDSWYKPENEEQVELLKRKLKRHALIDSFSVDKIKAGVWINAYYDYGGDSYQDVYKITTLEEYLEDIESLVDNINRREEKK